MINALLVDAGCDDDVHTLVLMLGNVINGSLHRREVSESSSSINIDGHDGVNSILRSVERRVIQCADPPHPMEQLILMNSAKITCCPAWGDSAEHERHHK